MKLVRSDSPEAARCIASARARVSRYPPAFVYGLSVNVLILLVALGAGLSISARAAVWVGVPLFLAWNAYVLWLTKLPRRNWCIAICAERVCIRIGVNIPEVIMIEASEITSVSMRTVEVFLYGPKPKSVKWLVIEPAQAVAEGASDHVHSLLEDFRAIDVGNRVRATWEEGRLIVGWKWCRPALTVFLQQIARECPSIVIGPEERSELDLNGIWHGISLNLDPHKRRLLVDASRLGFGSHCRWLLCRYKYISLKRAAAYLATIEREEAGTEHSAVPK